jgi:hypothetical protein
MVNITNEIISRLAINDEVILPEGEFVISQTIFIGSNKSIRGSGNRATKLRMVDGMNGNMFTNSDHKSGNENIRLENLYLDGNRENQFKPMDEKRVSFCNLVYFARVSNAFFNEVDGVECYQTVLHFSNCKNITINKFVAKHLGWSGISTSGTQNLVATNVVIYDSGNDHRHSAIHLDGGGNVYVQANIEKCVGNGVMLDATFSPFSHAVVNAHCSDCMRGIALIGAPDKVPQHILISGGEMKNNRIGIMVSNSSHAFIEGVRIQNNNEMGVLFQGRVGGINSIVKSCIFESNAKDIVELHNSGKNKFYDNQYLDG